MDKDDEYNDYCAHYPRLQLGSDELGDSQEWNSMDHRGGGCIQPKWPLLSCRQNFNLAKDGHCQLNYETTGLATNTLTSMGGISR